MVHATLHIFSSLCDAMLARYMLRPCVSVRLSVTSQCSIKTAKRIVTQAMLENLVMAPKTLTKFQWVHPKGRHRQVGMLKSTIFDLAVSQKRCKTGNCYNGQLIGTRMFYRM